MCDRGTLTPASYECEKTASPPASLVLVDQDVDSITMSWVEGDSGSDCADLRDLDSIDSILSVLGSQADSFKNWRVEIKRTVSSSGLPATDWIETLG